MSYATLLFDFDGVLVDSNRIRLEGFIELYRRNHPAVMEPWNRFLEANPGLSRYDKIRHFHTEFLGDAANEALIQEEARRYSAIVRDRVAEAPAIAGSLDFLRRYRDHFNFALISASDGEELKSICASRRIDAYFTEILGSPAQKSDNIARLLDNRGWSAETALYIGDSDHDRRAAQAAGVAFLGFGEGSGLNGISVEPITGFRELTRLADGWIAGRRGAEAKSEPYRTQPRSER